MIRKPLNEHFFDRESKIMMYILGISFSRYIPSFANNRNSWSSTSVELLTKVKRALETTASIGKPGKRRSRLLQVTSQHLQDKLEGYGLGVIRSERKFPHSIRNRYLDHFLRGFFDGNVSVTTDSSIAISYPSLEFIQGVYIELVANAGIRAEREFYKPLIHLRDPDVDAVYYFLYRDWNFIQKHELYLPFKKSKFRI